MPKKYHFGTGGDRMTQRKGLRLVLFFAFGACAATRRRSTPQSDGEAFDLR
ncbi:hypothetical protein [Corynebacterium cystitidis]|uniref:hypothetical protein n=1 Tax=Corynebacterium cystitidis TaxID=35757 RepID=UPI00211E8276|nr:hypothetical protein [Corynebacterium cystitidis]